MTTCGDTECPRACVAGGSRSPVLAGGGHSAFPSGGDTLPGSSRHRSQPCFPRVFPKESPRVRACQEAQGSCRCLMLEAPAVNCPVPRRASPARNPPDGPRALLWWLCDREENSALILGLGNLFSDFSPSERKNTCTRGFSVV